TLRAKNASRRVVRLICRNRISEFLRKKIGEVGTGDATRQRIGLVDEVPCPIDKSWNGNQPRIDALTGSRSLIVTEVEHLVLSNRSAKRAAELVLPEEPALR